MGIYLSTVNRLVSSSFLRIFGELRHQNKAHWNQSYYFMKCFVIMLTMIIFQWQKIINSFDIQIDMEC